MKKANQHNSIIKLLLLSLTLTGCASFSPVLPSTDTATTLPVTSQLTSDKHETSSAPKSSSSKAIAVTGVSLNASALTLQEGETKRLTATLSPSNATIRGVTWVSKNRKVATVSSSGEVTAIAVGNTSITVIADDGDFVATCTVTVIEKENASYTSGTTNFEIYTHSTSYGTTTKYIRIHTPIYNSGNVNLYMYSCTYDVTTKQGAAIMNISKYSVSSTHQILFPGEQGYFYAEMTYNSSILDGLMVTPHISIKNAKNYTERRYDVSDIRLETGSLFGVKAIGNVANNTQGTASSLDKISIILLDSENQYVITLTTLLNTSLNPGETTVFEATNIYGGSEEVYSLDHFSFYIALAYEWKIII